MNIGILHLSDLHLCYDNRNQSIPVICQNVAKTLNTNQRIEFLYLIVSGDITFSGGAPEFIVATTFFNKLFEYIYDERQDLKNKIRVACVPGNHDICHGKNRLTVADLEEFKKKQGYEKNLIKEIKKLNEYNTFVAKKDWMSPDRIFSRIVDTLYDDKRKPLNIEFNLINTSLFSVINGEYKGHLFFSQSDVQEFQNVGSTVPDFVFTIMHHSPAWFIDSISTEVEQLIYCRSSLVFLGHEHSDFTFSESTTHPRHKNVVLKGGAFSNKNTWDNSCFNLCTLDSATREFSQTCYSIDDSSRRYIPSEQKEYEVDLFTSADSIEENKSFIDEINQDEKNPNLGGLFDYFVFPRMTQNEYSNNVEIFDFKSFDAEIKDKQEIVIQGGLNKGKTKLLCYLFLKYRERESKKRFILYIPANSISSKRKDIQTIVNNAIRDNYSGEQAVYYFNQSRKEERIVLIDDFDLIPEAIRDPLYQYCLSFFGKIICTCTLINTFDLFSTFRNEYNNKSIIHLCLSPMYHDKRVELIRKVVSLSNFSGYENIDELSGKIEESIDAKSFSWLYEPDFLIKYSCEYCSGRKGSINDGNVFNSVFESRLTLLIDKYSTPSLNTEKIKLLLSKVAYYFYSNHKDIVSFSEIEQVVDQYMKDYATAVSISTFVDIVQKAKILRENEANEFEFVDKNYLAYFVAKEIHRNHSQKDYENLIKHSCFIMDSNILLFLVYLSDDNDLIELLVKKCEEYASHFEEFNFNDKFPMLLKNGSYSWEEKLSSIRSEEEVVRDTVEIEKQHDNRRQETNLTFNYCDEEIEKEVNQLSRLISLLALLSRSLSPFEHLLKADSKKSLVRLLYSLPNRIFYFVVGKFDRISRGEVEDFIDSIVKTGKIEKSKDEIFKDLQSWLYKNSIVMLLNLYYTSVFYSSKKNTYRCLTDFQEKSLTARIQHLMISEKVSESPSFVGEVFNFSSEMKVNNFVRDLFLPIVHHSLEYRKDLKQMDVQKLAAMLSPNEKKREEIVKKYLQNKKILFVD